MAASIGQRAPRTAYDSPTFGEDSSFHIDQPVGSMSISPCGRDVVLASKEGLHVIDLDNPYSPPRYLPHRTPWEVADVQWSPFAARDSWVASTSNQKALVWNLSIQSGHNSIEHILHAHTRAITDINFSAHHPDMLATCAVDSFVHCWDLRTPSKPVVSFSDWLAGATQVKWNRQGSHVIASSHDRFLHIWDDRKGAYPIRTIDAHDTKIYGLDWNRVRPEAIVTCSLDKTIKFWDISQEADVPEKVIRAPFPVSRTRHTPFGWGVVAMPQRGNSDLHLYSRTSGDNTHEDSDLPLVHSFSGHTGQVKEFLWRPRGTVIDGIDYREFQLVTWGTDKELRLHRVDAEIMKEVGYEKGKSFNPLLNLTRKGAVYKTFHDEKHEPLGPDDEGTKTQQTFGGMSGVVVPFSRQWSYGKPIGQSANDRGRSFLRADSNPIPWMRGVKIYGWDTETLGDEITQVGEKFTRVLFDFVSVGQRKATISMNGPWGSEGSTVFLKIDIKFPVEYPTMAAPVFDVQRTAAVTSQLAKEISSGIQKIAEAYLTKKRGCLEGVIRYLLGEHTAEECVTFIQKQPTDPLKSSILADDQSSDEDEDVGQFQSDDLALSSSELMRPINANLMVPVARACGALWANDGRLVCFFPKKEERFPSFLDSVGLRAMKNLSRHDKVFEGFGRLQTSSPGPKSTGDSALSGGPLTEDGIESEFSDDSSYESSSSSGSSDALDSLSQPFQGTIAWRHNKFGFHFARSTENSQKSAAGPGTIKSASEASQNSIHIFDFEELLPSRRALAQNYRIFGDRAEICSHNMSVATTLGHPELSHVWGLLTLLFQNQALPEGDYRAVYPPRKDSAIGLDYDDCAKREAGNHWSKIAWGEHPLGARWFIPTLFQYFESLGDIQMLGMLSCILYEPPTRKHNVGNQVRRRNSPFRLEDPQHRSRQIPGTQSQLTAPLMSKDRTLSTSHSSGCSSVDRWQANTPPLFSTGTTPPTGLRVGRSSMERKSRYNTSLAGSPDHSTAIRLTPNVGALASSLSRSLTFGPSASSSPPGGVSKRHPSPAGSFNAHISNLWGSGGAARKRKPVIPDAPAVSGGDTPLSESEHEANVKPPSPKSKRFKGGINVTLKNQTAFDQECQAEVSLLDTHDQKFYQAFRAQYANLLFIWGMPLERREVLKLTSLIDHESEFELLSRSSSKYLQSRCHHTIQNRKKALQDVPENSGLDLQSHCTNCGSTLQVSELLREDMPGNPPGKPSKQIRYSKIQCSKCTATPSPTPTLSCAICSEAVQGMFVPCLSCGHICCFECHREWFTPNYISDGSDSTTLVCPTGCGCNCSEHPVITMPMPSIPSFPLPPTPTEIPAIEIKAHNPNIKPKGRPQRQNPLGNPLFRKKKSQNGLTRTASHWDDEEHDDYTEVINTRGRPSIDERRPRSNLGNSGSIHKATGWVGTRGTFDRIDTI
ncbi:hypothetical protein FQN57_004390 [Myotisia sp. PD_48]|nr:hypothetical protein FQN57_004390 [Myotisia sp. PD_48]